MQRALRELQPRSFQRVNLIAFGLAEVVIGHGGNFDSCSQVASMLLTISANFSITALHFVLESVSSSNAN